MGKPPNPKPSRNTKSATASKRGPVPSRQDGALGAGGTSALVVICNYLFGAKVPAEVVAAAAPFIALGFAFCLALFKHYRSQKIEAKDDEEYERDIKRILEDNSFSNEAKEQLKVEWEEMRLLKIREKRLKIIARYSETVSTLNASSSEI